MSKPKEPDKMVRLSVEIPEQVRKELKSRAALDGYEMKEIVLKIIREYLDKNKGTNKK